MLKVDACPYCNYKEYSTFTEDGIIFHECLTCGLVYMYLRPFDHDVWDFYHSDKYYKQRLEAIAEHGRNASHEPRAARVAAWITQGKNHLDVGCAEGYLLRMTRAKGFDVLGVEPYPGYTFTDIPTVRKISQVQADFGWDNITCIHVLEHVADFKHLVGRMSRLLAPKGQLIIEVPGKKGGKVVSAEHLYYYPPTVIKELFISRGLKLVKEFEAPHQVFFFRKVNNA